MRVFVAGASGAIGTRLVAQLIACGHEVVGTYRTPGHGERIRALGATPVALDLLDARAVRKAVLAAAPGAIVHQGFASMRHAREGGPVKTEDDPPDPTPVPTMRETIAALRHLEEAVTAAGGIVLRYGGFYGA